MGERSLFSFLFLLCSQTITLAVVGDESVSISLGCKVCDTKSVLGFSLDRNTHVSAFCCRSPFRCNTLNCDMQKKTECKDHVGRVRGTVADFLRLSKHRVN